VPVDQVKRALTSKALSFFNERADSYHSSFLDDQRNRFLEARQSRKEGGQKGAAIKKMKKGAVEGQPRGQPRGQPEASLYQFPSSQVNSFSVEQEGELTDSNLEHHKEWLSDYDKAATQTKRKIQQ